MQNNKCVFNITKKSNLLILDEATSSVDTRTELLIQQAMDTLAESKTSFIIIFVSFSLHVILNFSSITYLLLLLLQS